MATLVTPEKIRDLQRALYMRAKKEPKFRFYALCDKVYRVDVLEYAYRLARTNGGAPGPDGVTFEQIEQIGPTVMLEELHDALKTKTYRPEPVRRVYIPKLSGGERPLGIPNIRDRVVQTAAKLVLEPIFEADFDPDSYGFRPRRDAHQALDAIKEALDQAKSYYIRPSRLDGITVHVCILRFLQREPLTVALGRIWASSVNLEFPIKGIAPEHKLVSN